MPFPNIIEGDLPKGWIRTVGSRWCDQSTSVHAVYRYLGHDTSLKICSMTHLCQLDVQLVEKGLSSWFHLPALGGPSVTIASGCQTIKCSYDNLEFAADLYKFCHEHRPDMQIIYALWHVATTLQCSNSNVQGMATVAQALHPRLGAQSPAHLLPELVWREVNRYVHALTFSSLLPPAAFPDSCPSDNDPIDQYAWFIAGMRDACRGLCLERIRNRWL